jgi:hypothetical protein
VPPLHPRISSQQLGSLSTNGTEKLHVLLLFSSYKYTTQLHPSYTKRTHNLRIDQ